MRFFPQCVGSFELCHRVNDEKGTNDRFDGDWAEDRQQSGAQWNAKDTTRHQVGRFAPAQGSDEFPKPQKLPRNGADDDQGRDDFRWQYEKPKPRCNQGRAKTRKAIHKPSGQRPEGEKKKREIIDFLTLEVRWAFAG
jgi:hypothetical protein